MARSTKNTTRQQIGTLSAIPTEDAMVELIDSPAEMEAIVSPEDLEAFVRYGASMESDMVQGIGRWGYGSKEAAFAKLRDNVRISSAKRKA